MSDDVSMGALSAVRSPSAAAPSLAAGCDLVLHCNGKLDEMRAGRGRGAGAGRRCRRAAPRRRWPRARRRRRSTSPRRAASSPTMVDRRNAHRMSDTLTFEDGSRRRARQRRAGAGGRRRGLRRPARPAAVAGAPAEGRSRQDLDPGAGRPVSRLHRGGAQAAARTRRRLSRDGGLARLPEVAPAAAGGRRSRRAERRGHGQRAGLAAQAPRGDPRGRRPS